MVLCCFGGKSELGWWDLRVEGVKVRALLHSCGKDEEEGVEVYMYVCKIVCVCVILNVEDGF